MKQKERIQSALTISIRTCVTARIRAPNCWSLSCTPFWASHIWSGSLPDMPLPKTDGLIHPIRHISSGRPMTP